MFKQFSTSLALGACALLAANLATAAPIIDTQLSGETVVPKLETVAASKSIPFADRFEINRKDLKEFYQLNDYQPVWIKERRWSNQIADLVSVISSVGEEGLSPSHYDIKGLIAGIPEEDEAVAKTDYLITAAYMRLVRDLDEGRYNYRFTNNIAKKAFEGIKAPQLDAWLQDLLPKSQYYTDLRRALKQYRGIVKQGDFATVPSGTVLKPGMTSKTIAQLRATLEQMGDYVPEPEPETPAAETQAQNILGEEPAEDEMLALLSVEGAAAAEALAAELAAERAAKEAAAKAAAEERERLKMVYDDRLVAAVKNFQSRHRLGADGIVGRATFRQLNTSAEYRVLQIKANMERLRWEFDPDDGRYIRVHMGSYKLSAFENDEEVLSMPVVIGKKSRPTPVLADRIVTLKFRPDWTVPPTIFREDYLPRIYSNPGWVAARGFELSYGGRSIDPYAAVASGIIENATLRQPPGDRGALGAVRFSLTNDMAIFLHDTPSKSYFKRSNRALSSGCVRVGDPAALAHYVMRNQSGWSKSRVQEKMSYGDTSYAKVDKPVPVFLSYITVWVGEDGTLQFQDDFYQYDNELMLKMI